MDLPKAHLNEIGKREKDDIMKKKKNEYGERFFLNPYSLLLRNKRKEMILSKGGKESENLILIDSYS